MRSDALAVLFACALAACATAPRIEADPLVDLSVYSTYRWAGHADADPALAEARASVSRWMASHGKAGAADGDISVAIDFQMHDQKRVMDFGEHGFFIPGHGFHPGITVPGAYPRYDVRVYTEGRIAIVLSDAQGPIWRGVAAGEVDPQPTRADIDRLVRAALANAARRS